MILVVGSTGALGNSVVRGLSASHKKVAALVRDASAEGAKGLRTIGATCCRRSEIPFYDRISIEGGSTLLSVLQTR